MKRHAGSHAIHSATLGAVAHFSRTGARDLLLTFGCRRSRLRSRECGVEKRRIELFPADVRIKWRITRQTGDFL
jgi:hypothetical protein